MKTIKTVKRKESAAGAFERNFMCHENVLHPYYDGEDSRTDPKRYDLLH